MARLPREPLTGARPFLRPTLRKPHGTGWNISSEIIGDLHTGPVGEATTGNFRFLNFAGRKPAPSRFFPGPAAKNAIKRQKTALRRCKKREEQRLDLVLFLFSVGILRTEFGLRRRGRASDLMGVNSVVGRAPTLSRGPNLRKKGRTGRSFCQAAGFEFGDHLRQNRAGSGTRVIKLGILGH